MLSILPKYKILFHTKENIHNKINKYKFTKRKWSFLKFKNQDFNSKIFYVRPQSLKHFYKARLLSYQKFKYFYGCLSTKQLKIHFKKISSINRINLIDKLILKLETRIDILLFRCNIFNSLFEIQQKINHKKIQVNFNIINYSNYLIKKGDFINFPFTMQTYNNIKQKLPNYIEYNSKLNIIILLRKPYIHEIQYSFLNNKFLILSFLQK